MIKTIIFDIGNVIVKVNREEMFRKFVSAGNKPRREIEEYYYNSRDRHLFETGRIKIPEFYNRFTKELGIKMKFKELKKVYCDIFSLNESVANLIKKLKKKFRLVLLSNTDILHYGYIKDKYKIIGIFDEYILSYKIGYMKPNPLIFLEALKKAKTLPFNCIYFDDIPEFIYVARLMGIRAFQFKSYEKLMRDLRKLKVFPQTL